MTKLTAQQELFAQEYVKCGNATQSYKKAYPKSQKWKDSAVYSTACQTLNLPKVFQRIQELKKELADRNLWTRERAVKSLLVMAENDRYINVDNGDGTTGNLKMEVKDADKLNAIKELNKMHGYDTPVENNQKEAPTVKVYLTKDA